MLEQGLSAYAIALPGGDDPDSYVQANGGEAFEEYARKHRQDFVAFRYRLAQRAGRLDTPEGEAATMREVLASIARIPDTLKPVLDAAGRRAGPALIALGTGYPVRRASEVLGVPDMQLRPVLKDLLAEQSRQARRYEQREAAPPPPADEPSERGQQVAEDVQPPAPKAHQPLPPEKILLRLMLEHGTALVEFILGHMALDEFSAGPARTIAEKLLVMYQEDKVEPQRFFDGTFDPAIQSLAAEVMIDRHEPSENWQRKQNIPVPRMNEDPYKAATSAMTLLKLERVRDAIDQHKERMYRAQQDGADLRPLMEQMSALQDLRRQIERREFLQW